ncbi:MAG: hypothetical protein JO165_09020, partial [Candidatus Eremiobacteraeota bacterium]|nr:hypothetical protein [Candidatus Eremiobacteraeota bacterium]
VGFYGLVASYQNSTRAAVLQVSTLGIVTNSTPRQHVFWGVDLRTFEHRAGSTSFRIVGDELRTYMGDSGAVSMTDAQEKDRFLIASAADGSQVIESLDQGYGQQPNERGFARTDRPIYRPGQTLHFNAVLRTGAIAQLAPSKGTRRVKVSDPSGNAIFDKTMKLDSAGELHADVRLPDAPLGMYSISVGDSVATEVSMEAYRKPEYEIALSATRKIVVGGDSTSVTVEGKYFFGRPAAGMHVHYTAYQNTQMRWYLGPYRFMNLGLWQSDNENLAEGQGQTDANGRFVIPIATKRDDVYRNININVETRDDSGRTVWSTLLLSVVPADFGIEMHPRAWFGTVNDPFHIDVAANGFDRTPRANQPLDVEIARSQWDAKTQKELALDRETLALKTNEGGKAAFDWTPRKAGSYVIRVNGRDSAGRATSSSLYVWIVGDTDDWTPPEQVALVSEKDSVAPGERANVLISVPKPDRDVLVVVGADSISNAHVIHVAGRLARYSFDVPQNAERFTVYAQVPSETGVSSAPLTMAVSPNPHALQVSVLPNRSRYQPGQSGTFALRVRDWRGHPVRAHVSLGLVDKALYAVQPDAFDPLNFYIASLYLNPQHSWYRPNATPPPPPTVKMIANVTSRAAGNLVRPGSTSDVYSAPAASAQSGAPVQEVRQNFADTAYWNPDIVTGTDGRADVNVVFPDNLTTWVATGVASTSSEFGVERAAALVTKDFLVRLALPRFLRQLDSSVATGIAQGLRARPDVTLSLDGYTRERLQLDGNATAHYAWDLSPGGDVGTMALSLRGSDNVLNDAMKLTLPIEPSGATEHLRDAGTLQTTSVLEVSLPPGYDAGDA